MDSYLIILKESNHPLRALKKKPEAIDLFFIYVLNLFCFFTLAAMKDAKTGSAIKISLV
jgi:hypothetical protein